MNRIIVITGMLASGKSTLADELALKYHCIALKKDSFKEALVDKYGYTNREENRQLSIRAVNEMFILGESYLTQNRDIILEANFRKDEIDKITFLSEKYHSKLFLFLLYGKKEILYERFLDRLPTRHKAHISIGLDKSIDLFNEYNSNLVNQLKEYNFVYIDMTNMTKNEVLDYVSSLIV